MEYIKKNLALVAVASGVAVLLFLGIVWYSMHQSVISRGNTLEQNMAGNYTNGANYLSSCVNKTEQAANVAVAQTDALDKILSDAVAGRYGTGAQMNGSLISAIQEAYPDLTGLDKTFQDALSIIAGCQDDYTNKQSVVIDSVREFNTWKSGSWKVRNFGGGSFPNDQLVVSIGDNTYTGQTALNKIRKPIVDTSVNDAYESGTTTQKNPFQPSQTPMAPPTVPNNPNPDKTGNGGVADPTKP